MNTDRKWMKSAGAAVVALGLVALATPAGSERGVTIQTFQLKPTPLEAPAGAKGSFTNQDDIPHTVTSGTRDRPDGKFSQKLEGKGAVATVELRQPGVYPYFCERHRSMRGEIRVK